MNKKTLKLLKKSSTYSTTLFNFTIILLHIQIKLIYINHTTSKKQKKNKPFHLYQKNKHKKKQTKNQSNIPTLSKQQLNPFT